jgi:hypothetical protein
MFSALSAGKNCESIQVSESREGGTKGTNSDADSERVCFSAEDLGRDTVGRGTEEEDLGHIWVLDLEGDRRLFLIAQHVSEISEEGGREGGDGP